MTKQEIKNIIIEILKKNNVKKASLFGSFLEKDFESSNDIDILIEFLDNEKTLLDLIGLKYEIEDRLLKKIDLLTYDSINPSLSENIIKNSEKLYG
ncbi:MAG: nucleotidyltransferase domain-containing protein [Candidatus Muiribacteriota bacterium]|jgi:predicted nucleotidyltransferase